MKLITKKIAKKLPKIGATDKLKPEYITIPLKLFLPGGRWTWYITEYDPKEGLMFGYVKSGLDPNFDELGYSSLEELEELKGPYGLTVERDMYWNDKTTLAEVMATKDIV